MIPARYAQIVWTALHSGKIEEVAVIDVRVPGAARKAAEHYDSWIGAGTQGWPTDEPYTPTRLFARLAFSPSQSTQAMASLLWAFGKIEECDWAREMLAEMLAMRERGHAEFSDPS